MNKHFFCLSFAISIIFASNSDAQNNAYWQLNGQAGITWNLQDDHALPHSDNIEMAGRKVAGIVTYTVDSLKNLSVERQVFFPQLHPFIKSTDPDWWIYRAYQKDTYKDDILPKLFVNKKQYVPAKLKNVQINGLLTFEHEASQGLQLTRKFYPDTDERLFTEEWTLVNTTHLPINILCGNVLLEKENYGGDGKYFQRIVSDAPASIQLQPKDPFSFSIKIMGKTEGEEFSKTSSVKSLEKRKQFIDEISNNLILQTPDSVLNTLFAFSKIRAAESIFDSELGLIHSPGGGRYYVGIWANDQAEYVSPFFPYLGYKEGNTSAINCFVTFMGEINEAYENIRYAFEMEGAVIPFKLDRGDAAMVAYGATQFVLANGKKATAESLWPLIEWCLEYCHRQLNEEGVVKSQSDEMEGRIETGNANLSTSSLYYGALVNAQILAKNFNNTSGEKRYKEQATTLRKAIDDYFGATIEGLETYKYYKEHKQLRHWICLPLVVGIHDRKEATIEALFDRLWANENGVYVEKNSENKDISNIFWDRGTLYALRGTFIAGATEISLEKLKEYSVERLLGKRVPYPVEAFPEGDMAHLSAESGLYCRIFTEGLFGMVPTGFHSFNCTPRLPKAWPEMKIRYVKAFANNFDITVSRKDKKIRLVVFSNKKGSLVLDKVINEGDTVHVLLDHDK